jgi:hypothetical protein
MKNSSVPAEIFGYLVCLLAVVIFFISTAVVVSSAFRFVHPTTRPSMTARGDMGRRGWQLQAPAIAPPAGMPGTDRATMRERFVGDARYDALRRFVVALVMLVLSIVVFRRTFGWLNPRQAVA